jgi:hypothetical protein
VKVYINANGTPFSAHMAHLFQRFNFRALFACVGSEKIVDKTVLLERFKIQSLKKRVLLKPHVAH